MATAYNLGHLIAISFFLYFLISLIFCKLDINNLKKAVIKKGGLYLLNIRHMFGIVIFGMLFWIASPERRYLLYDLQKLSFSHLIAACAIVAMSVWVSALYARNLESQDQSVKVYGNSDIFTYLLIRMFFLYSYEFFFRGILFFYFLQFNNLPVSIIYVTALYVLIHIFDSKQEILGAIPFGVVLCLFSYLSNSIVIAFVIHAALSVSYETSIFNKLTFKIQKT